MKISERRLWNVIKRKRNREKSVLVLPVLFQQLRTLNGLVKSRTSGSRTNSDSYNNNFYPLNDLPVY